MSKKQKYEFTPDMGAMTRWAAEGAWQEQLARQMLIAGLEWLEQERREYIGWRFWRYFLNNQGRRLAKDAQGAQVKTRALHVLLVNKLGDKRDHRDAPVIIGAVEHTLVWITSNSWAAFVADMRAMEKQEVAKMN